MSAATLTKTATAVATGNEWLTALAGTAPAMSTRPPVPVLSFAKVFTRDGGLYLEAFDYETSATVRVADHSVDVEPFLVPHKWLATTLKPLLGKSKGLLVGLSSEDGRVVLRCDGYEIPVDGAPVEEYPAVPATGELLALIDSDGLKASMGRLVTTASKDDTLPILNGVQLRMTEAGVSLCSTDRYRLGYDFVDATVAGEGTYLISAKSWAAVAKNLVPGDLQLASSPDSDRILVLRSGDAVYTFLTIDGSYPKIHSLIGAGHEVAVVLDRKKLLEVATVASKLTERNCPVIVTITAKGAMVTASQDAKSPIVAGDWLTGDFNEGRTVSLNPTYLLDAIKSFTTDTIRFTQDSAVKPMVFTEGGVSAEDDQAFRHMVMPVRMPS